MSTARSKSKRKLGKARIRLRKIMRLRRLMRFSWALRKIWAADRLWKRLQMRPGLDNQIA